MCVGGGQRSARTAVGRSAGAWGGNSLPTPPTQPPPRAARACASMPGALRAWCPHLRQRAASPFPKKNRVMCFHKSDNPLSSLLRLLLGGRRRRPHRHHAQPPPRPGRLGGGGGFVARIDGLCQRALARSGGEQGGLLGGAVEAACVGKCVMCVGSVEGAGRLAKQSSGRERCRDLLSLSPSAHHTHTHNNTPSRVLGVLPCRLTALLRLVGLTTPARKSGFWAMGTAGVCECAWKRKLSPQQG